MKRFLTPLLCAATLAAATFSCGIKEDVSKIYDARLPNWTPEIAAPMLKTSITLRDFIANFSTGGYLQIAPDGMISIVYTGEVFSSQGKKVLPISDASATPIAPIDSLQMNMTTGALLDFIKLKNTTFEYTFDAPAVLPATVILQMPSCKLIGQPFQKTIVVTTPGKVTGSASLDGYDFTLNNNRYPFLYTVNGGTATVLQNFSTKLKNMQFYYVEGFIGKIEFGLDTDTINVDMFKNYELGEVTFRDPRISINIRNSYGVPISVKADSLFFVNYKDQQLTIGNSQVQNGFLIKAPTRSQRGQFAYSSLVLDKNTSNIVDIVGKIPKQLIWNFGAKANPDSASGNTNFATDTSYFAVNMDVEFPLDVSATQFVVNQTFKFDFSVYSRLSRAKLKMVTVNEFPADIAMQVLFFDRDPDVMSGGKYPAPIDSMLQWNPLTAPLKGKNLISAATVGANGISTNATTEVTIADLDEMRMNKIKKARYIRVRGAFATVEKGSKLVKILDSYKLDVRMGVEAGADVSTEGTGK